MLRKVIRPLQVANGLALAAKLSGRRETKAGFWKSRAAWKGFILCWLLHKLRQCDTIIRPMSVYVLGYHANPREKNPEERVNPLGHEVEYSDKPELVFDAPETAGMHCEVLNGMQVYVGEHYCQFEIEKLNDGQFAIVCKSHPGLTLQEEIIESGKLLAEVAGSAFEGINKYDGHQLPYRWEFRTKIEPIQHVATIELTPSDVLAMNGKSYDQKLEYLHSRFVHFFK